ncbi:PIS1 [Ecytonucleospora hepatopenaei]|uniref:CDP-diacylglycerol--inositol 3-phosphatidyltransferase n=1 Tax=Ecytonucleospora hepatopenaei TaxID=646526 RepID=A0A1W0E350_9MICR|nr:PIS1 [Ecytonucleospora hepatopenaei]
MDDIKTKKIQTRRMKQKEQMVVSTNKMFYIPNIIGYFRIFLLLIGIFLSHKYFILCYFISVSLDFFDGKAARYFNQVSILGGALDMITDRVGTMLLCMKGGMTDVFTLIYIFMDVLAHMMYFLSSAYQRIHHKQGHKNTNILVRIYYNSYVLFTCVLCSELFFIVKYIKKIFNNENILNNITNNNIICNIFYYFLYIITLFKGFINIFHLYMGISLLSEI